MPLWHDAGQKGTGSAGTAWHGVAWHGKTRHDVIWYGIAHNGALYIHGVQCCIPWTPEPGALV